MSAASLAALPAPLRPTDDDWAKMLAAHVHLGTKNLDNKMVSSGVMLYLSVLDVRRHTACHTAALAAAVHGAYTGGATCADDERFTTCCKPGRIYVYSACNWATQLLECDVCMLL